MVIKSSTVIGVQSVPEMRGVCVPEELEDPRKSNFPFFQLKYIRFLAIFH